MILLVDDNPIQASARRAILTRAGFRVHTAHSAADAFEALESDTDRLYTLVITDHIMPGESGSHFVHRIWERRAGLPIMVLSGMADAKDDYAGLNVTFRAKPIHPDELISLVAHLSHNQPA